MYSCNHIFKFSCFTGCSDGFFFGPKRPVSRAAQKTCDASGRDGFATFGSSRPARVLGELTRKENIKVQVLSLAYQIMQEEEHYSSRHAHRWCSNITALVTCIGFIGECQDSYCLWACKKVSDQHSILMSPRKGSLLLLLSDAQIEKVCLRNLTTFLQPSFSLPIAFHPSFLTAAWQGCHLPDELLYAQYLYIRAKKIIITFFYV
jgi:hypothetical protein